MSPGLTPDEICSALKLCTTQASPVTPSPDPSPVTPVTADTTCVLCEYVITTLDSMLQDKTNEAEIKTALENLCSLLPSSVEKQCDTFVDTYTGRNYLMIFFNEFKTSFRLDY